MPNQTDPLGDLIQQRLLEQFGAAPTPNEYVNRNFPRSKEMIKGVVMPWEEESDDPRVHHPNRVPGMPRYNWNPSQPAIDEEIRRALAESESNR